jgi:hypothetical protein
MDYTIQLIIANTAVNELDLKLAPAQHESREKIRYFTLRESSKIDSKITQVFDHAAFVVKVLYITSLMRLSSGRKETKGGGRCLCFVLTVDWDEVDYLRWISITTRLLITHSPPSRNPSSILLSNIHQHSSIQMQMARTTSLSTTLICPQSIHNSQVTQTGLETRRQMQVPLPRSLLARAGYVRSRDAGRICQMTTLSRCAKVAE